MSRRVVVLPDAAAVARVTASRLLLTIIDAQGDQSSVHVALTGGGVGTASLAAMADDPLCDLVDWRSVHLWWSDERFLPAGDPERNETGARAALIDRLGTRLPAANVHPVPGPSPEVPDAETAARAYAAELAAHASSGDMVPAFDVLLLGVGPDGHVASLFPGLPATEEQDRPVVAVHGSPKPPPDRVSFTFPTLRAATQVWLLAAGAAKATAVTAAFAGSLPRQVPAAGAVGRRRTLWMIDAAASSG
ncbi:MAG: 6-phosphogluconolactonase [Micrococcales bacterium]|nr:6-phosphogluconolactonase [Micrococcales bacterium]